MSVFGQETLIVEKCFIISEHLGLKPPIIINRSIDNWSGSESLIGHLPPDCHFHADTLKQGALS